jgi:hypothetical protein
MSARLVITIAALGFGAGAWAQSPAPAAPAASGADRNEPKVQRIVVEDDAVRIDELRVRGQPQRIVVRPKLTGAPAYEIGTRADGPLKGLALWQLLAF